MVCSGRVKKADIRADQKWDFISLNDFKATSCFTPLAYGYLWVSLVISIAVYAVDVFTAVNLLAFDRWSGEIQPIISFKVSKWLFSACIIATWVNLGFEYLRAVHVMKRGAVAESYLDSLAVRLECIRPGKKGRGWKRFLVFAELTKSKKGAEYVALFTYFSFQAWIRIIFCQGPQKVINALTLWSVFKANLNPKSASNVGQGFVEFFKNIEILASRNNQQAVILSGMVFTLVIWAFAALSLILAVLFYIFFLWHYIPNADSGLSGYCERKINGRLATIVSAKVNKALEDEERKRAKADQKALKKGEVPFGGIGRQATLPTLFDAKEDKLPNMPMLNRNETTTTLPLYSSRPGTPSSAVPAFEMDELGRKRPFAPRTGTGSSYTSNAPLLNNASDMGFSRSASPAPSLPPLDTNGFPTAPQRTVTNNSQNSQWSRGPPGGPPRMPSGLSDRGYTQSPSSYTDGGSQRSPAPISPYGRPPFRGIGDPRSNTPNGPAPSMGPRTPFEAYSPGGRSSPAPGGPGSNYGRTSPPSPTNSGTSYTAYNPSQRSASTAPSTNFAGPGQQFRNMTDPVMRAPSTQQPPGPQRSATGMTPMNGGRGTPNGYGRADGPARLASPAPYVNNMNGRVTPQGYYPDQGSSMDAPGDTYRR
jgi:hypothetical protein